MMPNMTQLLSSGDQKIAESACLCFSRLVEAFAKQEEILEQIASHGMLMQVLRVLMVLVLGLVLVLVLGCWSYLAVRVLRSGGATRS